MLRNQQFCYLHQWFSTFSQSRSHKLSNLLSWTPHKSTQINTIPIFRPKSSEKQKKGHHVCTRPNFRQKSSEEQKKVIASADVQFSAQNQVRSKKRKNVLTSSDVLFSTENIGEELKKKRSILIAYRSQKDCFFKMH